MATVDPDLENATRKTADPVARFDAAAATYHEASTIQQSVAFRLASIVGEVHNAPGAVLEIGCGTGHLTRELLNRLPNAMIDATDASPEMLRIASERLVADSDRVDFRTLTAGTERLEGHFDLIVSSMTLQWIDTLPALLTDLTTHASQVAFSVPIIGSFYEWTEAHRRAGFASGTRMLLTESHLKAAISVCAAGLELFEIHDHHVDFPNAIDFVRSLRATGTTTPRDGHRPVNLRRVLAELPEGITANYRVAYVVLDSTANTANR